MVAGNAEISTFNYSCAILVYTCFVYTNIPSKFGNKVFVKEKSTVAWKYKSTGKNVQSTGNVHHTKCY